MAQIYEFNREEKKKFPEIRYGDRIFKVNNTKKTMRTFELMMAESNKDDSDEIMLKLFLGEEAAQYVLDDELPYPALTEFMELIMAAATDLTTEQISEEVEKNKKK